MFTTKPGTVKSTVFLGAAFCFGAYAAAYTRASNLSVATGIVWGITLALAAYGVFHRRIGAFCRKGVGRVLKYGFFAGVLVRAGRIAFLACHGAGGTVRGDEEVIIVLGAGLRGDQPGGVLRFRLAAALEAHGQNTNALLVVTGGQGPDEWVPEAVAMRKWLVGRGVPEGRIAVEDKSTSTRENFQFAKILLDERGIGADVPVAVVTSSYHCFRAGRVARAAGFGDVGVCPAKTPVAAWLPCHVRETMSVAREAAAAVFQSRK